MKHLNNNISNLIRHVTLRQLQIYEKVVNLGGYTRAAQALHLTQPTVSIQVKKLTEAIGSPLLEQVGRHIRPTAIGQDVYISAQEILEKIMTLEDTVSESQGTIKGELHIAVISTAKYFMPHLLDAFISIHPQVKPRLTVTNRERVLQHLTSNDCDLLIMGQVPKHIDVEAHPLIDNELIMVSHPNHPLAKEKKIPLKKLCQERFLMREVGSGTRQAVEQLFSEQKLKITPYMELGCSEAIKQGVIANLGISALSKQSINMELMEKHIAVLDVKEFPLTRRWNAVHLKKKHLSLVTWKFLEFILAESDDILKHLNQ